MRPLMDRDYIRAVADPQARVLLVGPPEGVSEDVVGSVIALRDDERNWWSLPWELEDGDLLKLAAGGVIWLNVRARGLPVMSLDILEGPEQTAEAQRLAALEAVSKPPEQDEQVRLACERFHPDEECRPGDNHPAAAS